MEQNDKTYELIEAYLRGTMNENELSDFERMLLENPELKQTVAEFKEVYDVLNEEDWKITTFHPDLQKARDYLKFYTDNKNKKYLSQLQEISIDHKNQSKMNIRTLLGTAAVAAVLVIGIVMLKNNSGATDYDALYAEYASLDELPTFTVRGVTDSVISLIETQFYAKEFEDVNNLISNNEESFDDDQRSLVSIYQGVAFGERGLYDEAYDVLSNAEIFENSIYAQMTDWYLALAFLNGESVPKAKELFKEMAQNDNHYKQAEAKQVLKKL